MQKRAQKCLVDSFAQKKCNRCGLPALVEIHAFLAFMHDPKNYFESIQKLRNVSYLVLYSRSFTS